MIQKKITLQTTKTRKTVDCKTNRILAEVVEYLKLPRLAKRIVKAEKQDFLNFFIRSLGDAVDKIDGHRGYCEGTLFLQRDFILKRRNLTDAERKNQMMMLVEFYRFIASKYPDEDFLDSAYRMTHRLLNNVKLPTYFIEGWDFISYSPTMRYEGQDRIIFVLHGFDKFSTRLTAEDYIPAYFDKIDSMFFRELLFDYMKSSVVCFGECLAINIGSISKVLNSIGAVKNSQFSSSKDESHWTLQEGRLMKRLIDSGKNYLQGERGGSAISLSTKNNRIGFMRRWFMWAEARGRMTFDRTFFDELSQFEEPTKRDAKPIPSEYLQPLFNRAREKAEKDIKSRLCYLSMKLVHQTNFRPSDILALHREDIQQSVSNDVYTLKHKTKTSGRSKQLDTITRHDYELLKEVMELTAPIRENIADPTIKDKIFVYVKKSGSIDVLRCEHVYAFMTRICKELGFPKTYGPYNLRYTYMTKVFEKAVANDLSNAEIRVLTKHVKLGTTLGYVKKNRTDYFKALFQVMMEGEQVNVTDKVVAKIPDGAQELGVREGGCGKCKAANCLYKSILPCITCENFVTTIEYEPFFRRMIQDIDEQLESAIFPHDREDLVTIKEIYVAFLIEIDKRKSEINEQ